MSNDKKHHVRSSIRQVALDPALLGRCCFAAREAGFDDVASFIDQALTHACQQVESNIYWPEALGEEEGLSHGN